MRQPSSRILVNRVDLYVGSTVQDAEGGFQQVYPAIPTSAQVPCSVQYQETAEEVNEQGRITIINTYWIIFAEPTNLTPRDQIIWVDPAGVTRTLFTDGIPPSEAGRHGPFTIRAIEKV
jgi:hypothetical protein